jgi:hypothetical protein
MSSEARTLTENNVWELATWCGGNPVVEHDALDHDKTSPGINVPTKDGVERASLGQTIIRKNDGTFEVFKG